MVLFHHLFYHATNKPNIVKFSIIHVGPANNGDSPLSSMPSPSLGIQKNRAEPRCKRCVGRPLLRQCCHTKAGKDFIKNVRV
jgi:hypothetical protein